MNPRIIFKLILISLLMILACNKEDSIESDFAAIKTLGVIDINEEGATLRAKIESKGNEPIISYGFLWDTYKPNFERNRKVFIGQPKSKRLSYRVKNTLYTGFDFNVRSFLITKTDTIYGNVITFNSKGCRGPRIRSFKPLIAGRGDTITVYGDGFSYVERNNEVRLISIIENKLSDDYYEAEVCFCTDSLLKFLVPNGFLGRAKLKVSWLDYKSISANILNPISPNVSEIFPSRGNFGDTIKILGNNFGYSTKGIDVSFNNDKAEIIDVKQSEMRVVVPDYAQDINKINIVARGEFFQNRPYYYINKPEITRIEPQEINKLGEEIIIHGKNFHPKPDFNNVIIGNNYFKVIEHSLTTLKIKMFDDYFPVNYDGSNEWFDVRVETSNMVTYSPMQLRIVRE